MRAASDQQIKIPMQLRLGDPSSFLFVTANAERGDALTASRPRSTGARPSGSSSPRRSVCSSTKIERFSLFPELEGREQAHAPPYTYLVRRRVSRAVRLVGPPRRDGMGEFFFDYGHDSESKPYDAHEPERRARLGPLERRALGPQRARREYFVRGFYFGNEPPDFPNKLYTRLGDPRHYGLTLSYRF